MFLSLESILDHILAKESAEGETAWLARALHKAIDDHGADLSFLGDGDNSEMVQLFINAHYSAIRCAVFHAKNSRGRQLQPGSLSNREVVLQQLLAVQMIVEGLFKSVFRVSLPSGGFFLSGFGTCLEKFAKCTTLIVSKNECPTIQQVVDGQGSEDDYVEYARFAGRRAGVFDEWVFESEIKCAELPSLSISTLRLLTYVKDKSSMGSWSILLEPLMEKINSTLLYADLDCAGVKKLVVKVRCVLRNMHDAQRGFTH
jgi:hypothetical protein